MDEYWATFSIYDHRTALYRQALILFDRVVIPVPTVPVGDVTPEEIDTLDGDVEYLEREGAAVRFDWDPHEFHDWQKKAVDRESVDGEALARTLVNDPPFATRLQLSQKYQETVPGLLPETVDSVEAMPVYGTEERFDSVTEELRGWAAEESMLQVVCKRLPAPVSDAPLPHIIELRQQPQFQNSMYKLRGWQMQKVPELLQEKSGLKRESLIRAAGRDFEKWIEDYEEAMADAKFKKVRIVTVSVLAVGATLAAGTTPLLTVLAGLAGPLLELRELKKPCWKVVANEDCAPAGVVYAAARL